MNQTAKKIGEVLWFPGIFLTIVLSMAGYRWLPATIMTIILVLNW